MQTFQIILNQEVKRYTVSNVVTERKYEVIHGGIKWTTQVGKSAYEVYLESTTDDPVKTKQEWLDSLKGDSRWINDPNRTGFIMPSDHKIISAEYVDLDNMVVLFENQLI